jgi:hypothetical protein
MSLLRRRSFLASAAAGIAGGVIAPTLWLPRRARAGTPGFGQAKHLLVINLDGGARSQCLFNANVSQQWNPGEISGIQSGAPGTDWGVGGVFPATDYDGGVLGEVIPAVPKISNQICVLGTVDHTPGEDRGDGNHASAQIRIATGAPDGNRGLLTIVYKDHPKYQGAGVDTNLPPVVIGDSARLFGSGTGEFGKHRPIIVGSWRDFRGNSNSSVMAQPSWSLGLEDAFDARLSASRSASQRVLVDGLRDSKRQAATFRPIFLDPVLDLDQSAAAAHGMTNEQLVAALGDEDVSRDVALALRFFSFGSPAAAVGYSGWDFHSDELTEFVPQAQAFARMLAGLVYALKRLQHPEGGTYWDHTLVVCTSEFTRDNTELSGFNSGQGSDHNGGPGCRYQALPFFGGLVGQGGKFFGETDYDTMEPKMGEPVFSSQSLLALCLDVLGIDSALHFADAPLTAIF